VPFTSLNKLHKKCWAKTILLSQSDMFWLFFNQFSFAGSQTKHKWSLHMCRPKLCTGLFDWYIMYITTRWTLDFTTWSLDFRMLFMPKISKNLWVSGKNQRLVDGCFLFIYCKNGCYTSKWVLWFLRIAIMRLKNYIGNVVHY
jgi:hypothetical protein